MPNWAIRHVRGACSSQEFSQYDILLQLLAASTACLHQLCGS